METNGEERKGCSKWNEQKKEEEREDQPKQQMKEERCAPRLRGQEAVVACK